MLEEHTRSFDFRSTLKIVGTTILLAFVGTYVVFQARFLIVGPQINLINEPPTQNNDRVITLSGNTQNITHLWLNGRQIFTDENGNFEEALVLENGYTITTLRATDRYGRETKIARSFVYTPASFIKN